MDRTLPEQIDFIAGEWTPATRDRGETIEDPNTGEVLQSQMATDDDGIERAIAASVAAYPQWSATAPQARAELLDGVADALEPLANECARVEALGSGATIGTTSMLSFIFHAAFRLAAEQLRAGVTGSTLEGPTGRDIEVIRLGWGPAGLLVPWNAPAPMAAHKAASALAAGCPVIIKPPERVPHGTAMLARGAEAGGLPTGVVQVVHGGPEVGGRVVTDDRVRAISFTGGVVAGRAIAHACAEGLKPAQLELGGHGPLVIMPDADTDAAADGAVALMTTLNGQWCRALGRLIVPAEREAEIVDAVVARLEGLTIGDSLDERSMMGPIVHSAHHAMLAGRVGELVARGGTVLAPSTLPGGDLAGGNWMSPTLVTGVDPEHTRSEIFGPVATVHAYTDTADALRIANDNQYGLEAYVIGTDEDAAMDVGRQIHAGGVKINGTSPMSLHLMAPRPAWGISGLADEGTTETIEFFCGTRVVGVENA
ncbi:MAG: aldehyde dehydrogenase [Actinomycetia bacterium]|nr:aldehyde dehydrogenase [Actinomycetes bacterium]